MVLTMTANMVVVLENAMDNALNHIATILKTMDNDPNITWGMWPNQNHGAFRSGVDEINASCDEVKDTMTRIAERAKSIGKGISGEYGIVGREITTTDISSLVHAAHKAALQIELVQNLFDLQIHATGKERLKEACSVAKNFAAMTDKFLDPKYHPNNHA